MTKKIAIIGGGIGGIAAGVALDSIGLHAVVFEKSQQPREVGAGMMLWPNATRILRELGLLDELLARSAPNTNFLVRTSRGKVLMDIALGKFEVPAICTSRATLLNTLLRALPAQNLRLGCELERFEQKGGKVLLHFANGLTEEFDALIGADGLRSRVRAQLFGAFEPVYRGYTVWRGIAHYHGPEVTSGFNSESWGHGKRFGILHTNVDQVTWYATANVPESHQHSSRGRKRELQQMFSGWHAPIEQLLEATHEDQILKNGARDCPPLEDWGRGMVTLLGDAAHPCTPNLGQGGGMALEDALVLARCLQSERFLRIALRRYETRRFHRTRHIQQRSLFMGYIGQWQNPLFVNGRKVVTRMLPARLIERNLRRVYAYTV